MNTRSIRLGVLSLATLAAATLPARAQVVEYYHLDGVGNVRAVTDAAGVVVERHDYLPFGEECTTGSCSPIAGSQPKRFTGKERDTETGLDYFNARYLNSKLGRFASSDPVIVPVALVDPQQWNRYSYARSAPLRFTDPSGLYVFDGTAGEKDRQAFRDALGSAQSAAGNLSGNEQSLVQESIAAYGAEGTPGVTVAFAKMEEGGTTGFTDPAAPFSFDAATGLVGGAQTVTLSRSIRGSELAIAVAHEGRHLADLQAYLSALNAEGTGGPSAMNGPLNLTRYAREVRGYSVSAFTAKGLGLSSLNYGGQEIWNSKSGLQPTPLNSYLGASKFYKLTPQSPGSRIVEPGGSKP